MRDVRGETVGRKSGGDRPEGVSYRIPLAIALAPIPISLLIAWALGDPPWRPRPRSADESAPTAPLDPRATLPTHGTGHHE